MQFAPAGGQSALSGVKRTCRARVSGPKKAENLRRLFRLARAAWGATGEKVER
jgi:hypothetical protein